MRGVLRTPPFSMGFTDGERCFLSLSTANKKTAFTSLSSVGSQSGASPLRKSLLGACHRRYQDSLIINAAEIVQVNLLQRMRAVGSALVIAAYFITLHLDVVIGVIIHLTAMSISVPYFIKSKAWDVVIMMTFLMTIGTGRLITAAMP